MPFCKSEFSVAAVWHNRLKGLACCLQCLCLIWGLATDLAAPLDSAPYKRAQEASRERA